MGQTRTPKRVARARTHCLNGIKKLKQKHGVRARSNKGSGYCLPDARFWYWWTSRESPFGKPLFGAIVVAVEIRLGSVW